MQLKAAIAYPVQKIGNDREKGGKSLLALFVMSISGPLLGCQGAAQPTLQGPPWAFLKIASAQLLGSWPVPDAELFGL